MKVTYTCAQVEIGGKHAKAHVQAFFIVSEPLNKKGMVKVVQHLFGKDGDGNFSSHLSWPPLGSTTDSRVYCTKPDNSDREWISGDRAVGTLPYEYGLFEEIEGHQIAQGDRSVCVIFLILLRKIRRSRLQTCWTIFSTSHLGSCIRYEKFFMQVKQKLLQKKLLTTMKANHDVLHLRPWQTHLIAFWPTASPPHCSHLGSIWREWEVRSERDLREYLWNALSRVRQREDLSYAFSSFFRENPRCKGICLGMKFFV